VRILFVSTDTNPFGQESYGDAQRTHLLLKACAKVGEVDVATFTGPASTDIENVRVVFGERVPYSPCWERRMDKWRCLLPCCNIQSLFPADRKREQILDQIIQNGHYDIIVVRYLFRAIPCGLLKYTARLVVDFDDDLPFFFQSQLVDKTSFNQRIRLQGSIRQARKNTPHTIKTLHATFFSELKTAQRNGGVFLPNIPYYSDTCLDSDFSSAIRRILFVGQLDYAPNREGLDHFLEHVYLPLTKEMPFLEMHIVGSLHNKAVGDRWEAYPGVKLTGYVDNLHDEYENCHLVVAPIYHCGGSNIKILEAMQMNRACVTTSDALAHFQPHFENQTDIVGSSTDAEYIDAIKTLLTDGKANIAMAHNGKSKVHQHYSFDRFAAIVASALKN